MKRTTISSIALIIAMLVAFIAAPAAPALAVSGAKIQVYDTNNANQLICTSTTAAPSCSGIRVIPGHRYRFVLSNVDGSLFKWGIIRLPAQISSHPWTFNSGAVDSTGGVNGGSASQSIDPIYWYVWGDTDSIRSMTMEATANVFSQATGDIQLTKAPNSNYTAQLTYTPLAGKVEVRTCGGTLVTPYLGTVVLSRNTCYKFKASADNLESYDQIELQMRDEESFSLPGFTNVSWSSVKSAGTCSNPGGYATNYRCTGTAGARQVSSVTMQGTTINGAAYDHAIGMASTLEGTDYTGIGGVNYDIP